MEEEGEGEEEAKARTTEMVPSEKAVEEHNLDHAVFRGWCPHRVKGRAEAYGHYVNKDKEKGVPTVGVDYMYMHGEQEKEEEKGMPIVVMKEDRTKVVLAKVVPSKGVDGYAVGEMRKAREKHGPKKRIMRSDNEPAMLALKEAVRKETDLEIVMEECPVGDHQANGLVGNAVKNVQGQFRSLKDALESRLKVRSEEEHPAVPWLVMHAASVMNRRRRDEEGFTPYPEVERKRLHEASRRVRRRCVVSASVLRRKGQVRREVEGGSMAGDKDGERRVHHRDQGGSD